MDVRHLDFYWVVPKIEAEVDAGQRDGFPRKGLHKDLHSPPSVQVALYSWLNLRPLSHN